MDRFAGRHGLAMGCMALSGLYGPVRRDDAIVTIRRALDLGIVHFDTAELYGPYSNEELLASALESARDVTVATKVGYRISPEGRSGLDSRPASLRRAVEGSLRRLRREVVDLVYQHRQDPAVPVEEAVGALSDLVTEGKVRWIGLSKVDAQTLSRANAVHTVAAVQNEISLLAGAPPPDLVRAAQSMGTIILAFSPLARGLIAETQSRPGSGDYRSTIASFGPAFAPDLKRLLEPLDRVAQRLGTSRTAVSLAWVRQKSAVPILGAKTARHLEEARSTLVLSAADVDELSGRRDLSG